MAYTSLSPPDKGYSWVILLGCYLAMMMLGGIAWSGGVFFEMFLNIGADEGTGTIALIPSLSTGIFYIASLASAQLITNLSLRKVSLIGGALASLGVTLSAFSTKVYHLHMTFGVLAGIGLGLIYIPLNEAPCRHFVRFRPLAIGTSTAGLPSGMVIFPPMLYALYNSYGWRGTLLLTGGMLLNLIVFASLLKSDKVKEEDDEQQSPESTYYHLWQVMNLDVLLYFIYGALYHVGLSIVFVHLGNYAITMGVEKDRAVMLFSVLGITNAIGRFMAGCVTQHPHITGIRIAVISCILGCAILLTCLFISQYFEFLIFATIFGFTWAGAGGVMPLIATELLDVKYFKETFAVEAAMNGVGVVIGPPIAGVLFDSSGNYISSFVLAAFTVLLSGITMIRPLYRQYKGTLKREEADNEYDIEIVKSNWSLGIPVV